MYNTNRNTVISLLPASHVSRSRRRVRFRRNFDTFVLFVHCGASGAWLAPTSICSRYVSGLTCQKSRQEHRTAAWRPSSRLCCLTHVTCRGHAERLAPHRSPDRQTSLLTHLTRSVRGVRAAEHTLLYTAAGIFCSHPATKWSEVGTDGAFATEVPQTDKPEAEPCACEGAKAVSELASSDPSRGASRCSRPGWLGISTMLDTTDPIP